MAAKPLAWRKPTDHPCDLADAELMAEGIGGRYAIQTDKVCGFVVWLAHDEFIFEPAATLEEAQAIAEADWQRRFSEHLAGAQ